MGMCYHINHTATGELFDAFDIVKNNDGINTLVERKNEALLVNTWY